MVWQNALVPLVYQGHRASCKERLLSKLNA